MLAVAVVTVVVSPAADAGITLNGITLNGLALNGAELNGSQGVGDEGFRIVTLRLPDGSQVDLR